MVQTSASLKGGMGFKSRARTSYFSKLCKIYITCLSVQEKVGRKPAVPAYLWIHNNVLKSMWSRPIHTKSERCTMVKPSVLMGSPHSHAKPSQTTTHLIAEQKADNIREKSFVRNDFARDSCVSVVSPLEDTPGLRRT